MTEQFCCKENVYWRKSMRVFYLMTSDLGAVCPSTRSRYQELIRNGGLMRDRKQHTGILLLNVPWQCWGKSNMMGEFYPSWHLKVFNSSFDHVGYNESAFWMCFKTGRIRTLSSWYELFSHPADPGRLSCGTVSCWKPPLSPVIKLNCLLCVPTALCTHWNYSS